METFRIQGRTRLTGTVEVSGAKNAALPMMCAALLSPGKTVLSRVPDLADVRLLGRLLQTLGAEVQRESGGDLAIEIRDEQACLAEEKLVQQMRASICVLGPLLARRGHACVALPGGCRIGHRPIDLHLKGLAALGAEIDVHNGYVVARARQLRGKRIDLSGPHGCTVTGTGNVLTAATLARGTTVIDNAASEPEIVALADCLNAMGAKITGQGTSRLVIDGVRELAPVQFTNIPDRIEAATLLIAAAITGGDVTLQGVCRGHLSEILVLLERMGAEVTVSAGNISVSTGSAHPDLPPVQIRISVPRPLHPLDVDALPYPGIPTDVQAQLTALLTTLPGQSRVRDFVFPQRFLHAAELVRMGARIQVDGGTATIQGVHSLSGAEVTATDLRASAALVLAGLAASGETVIQRIDHLDRGYERLEEKLTQLGARILRVPESCEPFGRRSAVESSPDSVEPSARRKSA